MKTIVGRTASVWGCSACHQIFVWHAGVSGLRRPSECGNCGTEIPFHIVRLTPRQMVEFGFEYAKAQP
jgi:hypothetical protein